MKIIRKTNELGQILVLIKDKGQSIGSVLTMGNLHDGHLSLIKEAQLNNDFVVTSIFINPTQFNNEADFSSYPKTIDDDIAKLEKTSCNLLFLPEIQEIYPGDLIKQNIGNQKLPNSEDICSRHICLPIYLGLKNNDARFISNKIIQFLV